MLSCYTLHSPAAAKPSALETKVIEVLPGSRTARLFDFVEVLPDSQGSQLAALLAFRWT